MKTKTSHSAPKQKKHIIPYIHISYIEALLLFFSIFIIVAVYVLITNSVNRTARTTESDAFFETQDIESDFTTQSIGGEPVADGEYPFVVYVIGENYSCSGSLIADQWVLTAAHCTVDYPQLTVRVGYNKLSDQSTCLLDLSPVQAGERCDVDVVDVYNHPDYQIGTKRQPADIALLKLAREVGHTKISLPTGEIFVTNHKYTRLLGYGLTSVQPRVRPERIVTIIGEIGLLEQHDNGQVTVWSYPRFVYSEPDAQEYSAGPGDSGGPVIGYSALTGKSHQVAVLRTDDNNSFSGSSTYHNLEWIKATTGIQDFSTKPEAFTGLPMPVETPNDTIGYTCDFNKNEIELTWPREQNVVVYWVVAQKRNYGIDNRKIYSITRTNSEGSPHPNGPEPILRINRDINQPGRHEVSEQGQIVNTSSMYNLDLNLTDFYNVSVYSRLFDGTPGQNREVIVDCANTPPERDGDRSIEYRASEPTQDLKTTPFNCPFEDEPGVFYNCTGTHPLWKGCYCNSNPGSNSGMVYNTCVNDTGGEEYYATEQSCTGPTAVPSPEPEEPPGDNPGYACRDLPISYWEESESGGKCVCTNNTDYDDRRVEGLTKEECAQAAPTTYVSIPDADPSEPGDSPGYACRDLTISYWEESESGGKCVCTNNTDYDDRRVEGLTKEECAQAAPNTYVDLSE